MFGIILLITLGVLIIFLAKRIYDGKIDLIMDHHQRNLNSDDRKAYGEEFSWGLFVFGMGCIISAIALALGINYIVGILLGVSGIICVLLIAKAQKKYNGGWF